MNKWIKLIVSILFCQLAGIIGSIFTVNAIPTWYENLKKPAFSPPNWAFGPVWITLYTLMGISLYLILNKKKNLKIPLTLFFTQLVLNSIWSIIFFGFQSSFYALIEIVILWFAILFTILSFYKVSKNASFLLLPYIIWVSAATVLNYYILILNP